MMKKIKITSTGSIDLSHILSRQTPTSSLIWGDCKFYINTPLEECDFWFILHSTSLKDKEGTIVDPKNIIFFSMEPLEFYPSNFYHQFSKVFAVDNKLSHKSLEYFNIHTWWVGINVEFNEGHKFYSKINYDYETLNNSNFFESYQKKNRISIITSNNKFLPGHKIRLNFIEKLRNSKIAEYLDIYGGGHNPILDKMDGLLPYKYHISLENTCKDNYWTEKLADAFLANTFPIYYGCPNISTFFPKDSFLHIDIEDFTTTVNKIEKLLMNNEFENRKFAISQAKNLILNDYNVFNIMYNLTKSEIGVKKYSEIKSPAYFKNSLLTRINNKLKKYY